MNKNDYIIRLETPIDYEIVENLTREAFWNVHVPGCDEHYLAHILRDHEDFIPELDFVLEVAGKIIGNIMLDLDHNFIHEKKPPALRRWLL